MYNLYTQNHNHFSPYSNNFNEAISCPIDGNGNQTTCGVGECLDVAQCAEVVVIPPVPPPLGGTLVLCHPGYTYGSNVCTRNPGIGQSSGGNAGCPDGFTRTAGTGVDPDGVVFCVKPASYLSAAIPCDKGYNLVTNDGSSVLPQPICAKPCPTNYADHGTRCAFIASYDPNADCTNPLKDCAVEFLRTTTFKGVLDGPQQTATNSIIILICAVLGGLFIGFLIALVRSYNVPPSQTGKTFGASSLKFSGKPPLHP
jgi:hypothetical protein